MQWYFQRRLAGVLADSIEPHNLYEEVSLVNFLTLIWHKDLE